jgi:TolA-binding protein
LVSWWFILSGCATPSRDRAADARQIFAAAVTAHNDRQFAPAATGYERLLRQYPDQENLCAQAMRSLGNVRAAQGRLDDARKLYRRVGEKYPQQEWEVIQAWKSAGDMLWDAGRTDDSKVFYRQIVERFDKPDAPQVVQTIVRAAKARQ